MSAPPAPPETAEAAFPAEPGPTPPLSFPKVLAYSLANLGYGAFYALNNAVLPLFLSRYTHNNVIIGLMGSTHSFEGAVIQPIVGSASDRLRTPLGRRRPFMLIFAPLSALFLLLTPLAGHLPPALRVAAMVASIFLFTVFFNIAEDPFKALMPDITPERQRGRVSGVSMFVMVAGQAALVLLRDDPGRKFAIVAAVMLVTTLLTCALIREPKHPVESGPRLSHGAALREALRGLKTLFQASKALMALFSGLGIGAVFPFLTLFVKKITGCSDGEAQHMFLILMIATALGVLPFGWLADRIGAKNVLLLGLVLITLAAVNGLWVTTLHQITWVMWLAGVGNAANTAASYPLLTDVVPSAEVGFYTGLQSTALSIATPLTAAVTGQLINAGGYRVIFGVCGVCLSVAFLVLTTVRMHRAGAEVRARNLQQGREAS